MDAIVRFDAVSKSYDGHTRVVRDLTLEVERGEFLTLLGPSGSGKTTSLMMLAGFEAPTSGEIFLDGKSLSRLPPHKRDIGVVFQNYALFPHMSTADNIAFPLQIRRLQKEEVARRVSRALDMVRLPHIGPRRPNELSGGQQQRVALARALVFEPKIVLMDEPLGALDRQLREEMQLEIRSIHERLGVTVVYVTHDQGEALAMSDRIAIFNDGVVEQLAVPEALYENPANAFVARFVGDNNMLEGVVTRLGDDDCEFELPGTGRIIARRGEALAESGGGVVTIRPEKVEFGQTDEGDGRPNSFRATVEEIVYLGDHAKLILRLRGGQLLIAKMRAGALGARGKIGQQVGVLLDQAACVAFTTESGRHSTPSSDQ